jgi:hypothetical protein
MQLLFLNHSNAALISSCCELVLALKGIWQLAAALHVTSLTLKPNLQGNSRGRQHSSSSSSSSRRISYYTVWRVTACDGAYAAVAALLLLLLVLIWPEAATIDTS